MADVRCACCRRSAVMKAEEEEFKRLKLIHGAHAPLRMKMERMALSQIPGHAGLNTSAGLRW